MNKEMNTNGENVRNNRIFAKSNSAKLFMNSCNVKPVSPATKPNARVDKLVTTVKIKIQIRNMRYLEIKNFPLDIGTVSMVFNVCSLYSLPKR
jgi:hypothetical protein